jgi:hypothetical protein
MRSKVGQYNRVIGDLRTSRLYPRLVARSIRHAESNKAHVVSVPFAIEPTSWHYGSTYNVFRKATKVRLLLTG